MSKDTKVAMTPADQYRAKAAELDALARLEASPASPAIKAQFLHMAAGYRRLAEMADRNAMSDLTYEPPLRADRASSNTP
jgi:hypothetical protein